MDATSAFLMFRVVAGFALAYGLLPWLALPKPAAAESWSEHAGKNFVRFLGISLALGHVLAAVRLFHVAPILLLGAYGWWRTRKRDGETAVQSATVDDSARGRLSPLTRAWLRFTDLAFTFEQRGSSVLTDGMKRGVGRMAGRIRSLTERRTVIAILLAIPIVVVFAWSLWSRMELVATHTTLSPPQSYVTLTWTKSLLAQELYPDGVYPAGLLVFLGMIARATPGVDAYEMVRFAGPLVALMVVVGLYYCVTQLTRNRGAGLLTAVAFGVYGTAFAWHEPWVRQTGALPHELGLVAILFAIPSAVASVGPDARSHRWTVAWAALGAGLIHPVTGILLLVVVSAVALLAGIARRSRPLAPFATLGYASGAAALSQAPIALGLLIGIPLHRGLDNPYAVVGIHDDRTEALTGLLGTSLLGHNLLTYLAAGGAVLAVVAGIVHALRGDGAAGARYAGLGAAAGVAVALYDVRWLDVGINHLGPLGNVTGIMTALGLGAGAGVVLAGLRSALDRLGVPVSASLAIVLAVGAAGAALVGTSLDHGQKNREPSEYEATAEVTRQIMRSNEDFGYTIIGTPQQSQAVAGVGSFIELWVFARDVTLRDARDPGYVVPDVSSLLFARDLGETLPIPTQNIYLFVEKEPFPIAEQAPVGPTEEYYYDREKRGRIMALAYGWAEYYRHYHTDMDVYYEDDEVVVYRIQRRPNVAAAASSPQFKDYTWERGQLFTGGPADPDEVEIPWRQ